MSHPPGPQRSRQGACRERRDEINAAFWAIFDLGDDTEAGDAAVRAAQANIDAFARRYDREFPTAVKCLQTDRQALTPYLRFPNEHWRRTACEPGDVADLVSDTVEEFRVARIDRPSRSRPGAPVPPSCRGTPWKRTGAPDSRCGCLPSIPVPSSPQPGTRANRRGALQGEIHSDFESAGGLLEEFVHEDGAGGGAVAAWHRGEKVLDVWAGAKDPEGTPWEADTLAMCFSTTKGVTATAVHMCVDRELLDYDDRVSDHWPEFAQNGKAEITVRQVMCHEAGLYPVRRLIDHALELNDWELMIRVLEEAAPAVEPGTANAYHGFTYGWLAGELVRRTSGKSIGEFVQSEIAMPLELDGLFIGLPEDQVRRLATLIPGKDVAALQDAAEKGDLAGLAAARGPVAKLAEAMGLEIDPERIADAIFPPGMNEWIAHPETVKAQVPAANGCFTARSLAKLYGALARGGEIDGVRLLSGETLERATQVQNTRPDLVLVMPMQWRLGWHMAFTAEGIPPRGFGHFGFGGSGAWADPDHEVSCAFVCNRMGGSAVGDMRMARLGAAVWSAAQRR